MELCEAKILLKQVADFDELYVEKRKTLPYHINLIDELKANENAHSRIFIKLLCSPENGRFPIFESFLEYLEDPFKSIKVNKPCFTSERHRIDVLIVDNNNYAIIIENKIYGAQEQPGQIDKYIKKIIEEHNISIDQIFVLFLTKTGGEPTKYSLSDENRRDLDCRYKPIDYSKNILPWLENHILPTCRFKDTYLISALQQYIDYLKGLFHDRKIDIEMNEELKVFISRELTLHTEANNILKFNKLKNELSKLDNLSRFIQKMQADLREELFKEWYYKLKEKYNSAIVTNIDKDQEYFYIGVKMKYKGKEFCCAIGIVNYFDEPYYGITYHGCKEQKKIEEIDNFVNEKFRDRRLALSPRWYGYMVSELDNIFEEYKTFLEETLECVTQTE